MSTNGDHADEPDRDPTRPGPRAAYAVNWKTVLAVDAAMGGAVVLAGLIALVEWNFWLGAFLMLAGCVYVAMVGRRANHWRSLRRAADL